jgi:hypothetical protein
MQKFDVGTFTCARGQGKQTMKTRKIPGQELGNALDIIHQVQAVNHLVQGVCLRIPQHELTAGEAEGLWFLIEWQNAQLKMAGDVISEMVQPKKTASCKAA